MHYWCVYKSERFFHIDVQFCNDNQRMYVLWKIVFKQDGSGINMFDI